MHAIVKMAFMFSVHHCMRPCRLGPHTIPQLTSPALHFWQRLNSEYASLVVVRHHGEVWFASCSNRKYVRCQDELMISASGTETVQKCYVEKTSQCIKARPIAIYAVKPWSGRGPTKLRLPGGNRMSRKRLWQPPPPPPPYPKWHHSRRHRHR